MWYIVTMKARKMEIKNGYYQNVVPTTTEQNLAAAKECETFHDGVSLFRALEYSNDRGTGGTQFDELREHYDRKEYRLMNLEMYNKGLDN